MPQNITIAAFVFGSVLLLIALLGGKFKIFGAEVDGVIGSNTRIFAGILGVIFLGIGLYGEFVPKDNVKLTGDDEKETKTPITITYELGKMVKGSAIVYIDGKEVGVLTINKSNPESTIRIVLPKTGTYEYSIQAKMTIMGFLGNDLDLEIPFEESSSGRGTIEVEANKEFLLTTNNIVLDGKGNHNFSELEDKALK